MKKHKTIKKTGKFDGKSNVLGHGGRASQLKAEGVPGGVIGALARRAQAAPGQKNYHGKKMEKKSEKAKKMLKAKPKHRKVAAYTPEDGHADAGDRKHMKNMKTKHEKHEKKAKHEKVAKHEKSSMMCKHCKSMNHSTAMHEKHIKHMKGMAPKKVKGPGDMIEKRKKQLKRSFL